ncbi:sulfite exporter TauE/SafE family protein [Blastococcus sp. Marseille-P5729]|uniref:sulfite exporter TauE/SafE family protein n=1 Tax=Blastococcus sp. Marseille-P5729 TaxID=2086582 RepID=UPI000D0F5C87|nr:sulfite exporter TauE/SafE family protein [Blastococcus sp. Marseille-P5729]
MSTWALVVSCGLLVGIGAVVQGVIGLGMALIASPVIALLDQSLVPGMLIITSIALPVLTLIREHDDIDWKGLAWAFPWRFAGTALGTWLVVVATPDVLGLMVGVFVISAVVLSVIRWKPRPSPAALSIGALVSGVGGTATSIGGPPMALVYQNQRPSMLRCTMAVYFLIGSIVSLSALAFAGELSGHQVRIGLAVLPFVTVGFIGSLWVRNRVDPERIRTGVLAVSALASIVLILRALL